MNLKFTYKKVEGDFTFYTFEHLLNDIHILALKDLNDFKYCLIEGKRTDRKQRIWLNQIDNIVAQEICYFFDNEGKKMFGEILNDDFTKCRTRIELCNDLKGSYLEQHVDDPAKVFTLQVHLYTSNDSTILGNSTTKAQKNRGWFFKNTAKEWHSLNPLQHDRSSIILNYVNKNWRDESVLV